MIVQIYEIQTPQDAEKCIELGVNHLGSVLLSQEAWRVAELKEVMLLTEIISTKNSLIPLFQDMDVLCRTLDYYRPHYVHFCDSLVNHDGRKIDLEGRVRFQSELRDKFPEIGIIRSIPIPGKGVSLNLPPLTIANSFEPISDIFLADTWLGKEPVDGYIGITGKTPDWEIAGELVHQSKIPVILAGGLSPGNVFDALMKVAPAGADSCTQTNRVDGEGKAIRFKKDFHKVKRFVKEVRRAQISISA